MLQVAAKKLTLKNVTDYITDVICKRAELGFNYGVILVPEGLIDFIPEVTTTSQKSHVLFYSFHFNCFIYLFSFSVYLLWNFLISL